MNIHNLNLFQGGKWLELTSNSSLTNTLFSSQNIFRTFFVIYFLVIPTLAHSNLDRGLVSKFSFPIPGKILLLFTWIPIIISSILTILATSKSRSYIAETRELFYAATIFFYVTAIGKLSFRVGNQPSK